MKEVTKEEFYNFFNYLLNVKTAAVGNYPYDWEVRQNHRLIAKQTEEGGVEKFYILGYESLTTEELQLIYEARVGRKSYHMSREGFLYILNATK